MGGEGLAWPGLAAIFSMREQGHLSPAARAACPDKEQPAHCGLKRGKKTTKLTIFTLLPAPFLLPTMFPQAWASIEARAVLLGQRDGGREVCEGWCAAAFPPQVLPSPASGRSCQSW